MQASQETTFHYLPFTEPELCSGSEPAVFGGYSTARLIRWCFSSKLLRR
jgi:hypothetical protein